MGLIEKLSCMIADGAAVEALIPWPCPSMLGNGDRYRLIEVISMTERSVVYQAVDEKLSTGEFECHVAIKVFPKGVKIGQEPMLARRIEHPNVVRVFDIGRTSDHYDYIVMEFVDGSPLQTGGDALAERKSAVLVATLARGTQVAHSAGVCHCDLKPDNILLTSDGVPKIIDFGMAKYGRQNENACSGSLAFMAPEQFFGAEDGKTPSVDTYALGGVLYYLLTGEYPNGQTVEEITARFEATSSVTTNGLDVDLGRIIRRATAWHRRDRYESTGQLADDLNAWAQRRPLVWNPSSPARRSYLWMVRNRLSAGLFVILVSAIVSSAVNIRLSELRAAAVERETHAEVIRQTDAQVAELKEAARGLILGYAQAMWADPRTEVPVFLSWEEWLYANVAIDMVSDAGSLDGVLAALESAREGLLKENAEEHIEALLVGLALAHTQVAQGRWAEGQRLITSLKSVWADRLAPQDTIKLVLAALEDCADAQRAAFEGGPTIDQIQALRASQESLKAAGMKGPTLRLVKRVLGEMVSANPTSSPR